MKKFFISVFQIPIVKEFIKKHLMFGWVDQLCKRYSLVYLNTMQANPEIFNIENTSLSDVNCISHDISDDIPVLKKLSNLLVYSSEEFIERAYNTILNRQPGPEEKAHYLSLLWKGEPKIEILGRLRFSQEGKLKKVKIPGLYLRFVLLRLKRLPVIGFGLHLLGHVVHLPYLRPNRGLVKTTEENIQKTLSEQNRDGGITLEKYPNAVSTMDKEMIYIYHNLKQDGIDKYESEFKKHEIIRVKWSNAEYSLVDITNNIPIHKQFKNSHNKKIVFTEFSDNTQLFNYLRFYNISSILILNSIDKVGDNIILYDKVISDNPAILLHDKIISNDLDMLNPLKKINLKIANSNTILEINRTMYFYREDDSSTLVNFKFEVENIDHLNLVPGRWIVIDKIYDDDFFRICRDKKLNIIFYKGGDCFECDNIENIQHVNLIYVPTYQDKVNLINHLRYNMKCLNNISNKIYSITNMSNSDNYSITKNEDLYDYPNKLNLYPSINDYQYNGDILLSIAVSTYNRGNWLEFTVLRILESIANCEYKNNIEFFIVDNTSTDNTEEVCEKLKEKYNITVYRNKENVGMLPNLSVTSKLTTGKYIWILGDDDIIYKNSVNEVMEKIIKYDNIDLIYLNYNAITAKNPDELDFQKMKYHHVPDSSLPSGIFTINSVKYFNENLFTSIYCCILRRDHGLLTYNQNTEKENDFKDIINTAPSAYYILKNMLNNKCYWIQEKLLTVNFNTGWSKDGKDVLYLGYLRPMFYDMSLKYDYIENRNKDEITSWMLTPELFLDMADFQSKYRVNAKKAEHFLPEYYLDQVKKYYFCDNYQSRAIAFFETVFREYPEYREIYNLKNILGSKKENSIASNGNKKTAKSIFHIWVDASTINKDLSSKVTIELIRNLVNLGCPVFPVKFNIKKQEFEPFSLDEFRALLENHSFYEREYLDAANNLFKKKKHINEKCYEQFSILKDSWNIEIVKHSNDHWLIIPEEYSDKDSYYNTIIGNVFDHADSLNLKTIAIYYDSISMLHNSHVDMAIQEGIKNYLNSICRSNIILPSSETSRCQIVEYLKKQKIEKIPLIADVFLPEAGYDERVLFEFDNSEKYIASFGDLSSVHNQLNVIKAFNDYCLGNPYTKYRLALMYDIVDEAYKEKLIAKIGKNHRIYIFYNLNNEELENFYERIAFTIYPGLFDPNLLTIYNSLWRLRPCICHNSLDIKKGGCVTIDLRDPRLITAHIQKLTNIDFYKEKIDEICKSSFKTWSEYAQEVIFSTLKIKNDKKLHYNKKLSICMPVYNFEKYIHDSLSSILEQANKNKVLVVLYDGCSTDSTFSLVREYLQKYDNIRYIKALKKGGIDLDMTLSVGNTCTEYTWLFSGDDMMVDGAIDLILKKIESNPEMILVQHSEHQHDFTYIHTHPILYKKVPETMFNLRDKDSLKKYLENAITSEAFFSFMGGIIIKRKTWFKLRLELDSKNKCWAHITRLWNPKIKRFKLLYLPVPLVKRRGGNDSWGGPTSFERFKIQILGLNNAVERVFSNKHVKASLNVINFQESYPGWWRQIKGLVNDEQRLEFNQITEEMFNKHSWVNGLSEKEIDECIANRWMNNNGGSDYLSSEIEREPISKNVLKSEDDKVERLKSTQAV